MASLKQILTVSLPITIVLVILAILSEWTGTIFVYLVLAAILQSIFWKFVKHT